ncbi:heterodisulfide reductase-related iron-sulfur binding cluster [Saccharopolyspora griseoalba]|uniref:Heterodisulfide reductase-related iron-sulfur binding cluster n=1 Tax=Saccharopolyspora griseoalba TaxID=1431848 RepID=A0ABW2LTI1_9PSEU
MAMYKAEFLAQHYRNRPRPITHYSLGWLPVLARGARLAPRLVNATLHAPGVAEASKRIAGITPERAAPRFAPRSFQQQWRRRPRPEPRPGDHDAVVLWPDTFTNHFEPRIARSAVEVLERAGFRVAVPDRSVCCGLTLISTGQLQSARRMLRRTFRVLRPWIEAGTPVVGVEPSWLAVFRSDVRELLPHDEDAERLLGQFLTLAEALTHHAREDWRPPRREIDAIVQTHRHQHAVLGFAADERVLHEAGVDADVLDSGCCGLAGDFGFERGHYDVSMACAEHALLPAVRRANPGTTVVAEVSAAASRSPTAATARPCTSRRSWRMLDGRVASGEDGPDPAC